MMSALIASKNTNNQVYLYEKNDALGKKLDLTGKGRCNLTYVGDKEYFLDNVVTNSNFLQSAIASFNNNDLRLFAESLGVKTKEERGNRVFLSSDNANCLTIALKLALKKAGVHILYNHQVKDIKKKGEKFCLVTADNTCDEFDRVVISTGGKSYPKTGSTGDGYIFAKKLGHTIVAPNAALVPIIAYEKDICKALMGVTLKNVKLKVLVGPKEVYTDFGECLFTSNGLTGPIVLSASSQIAKIEQLDSEMKSKNVKLEIDMKPALTEEQLYARLTRDFEKYSNKEMKNALKDLTIMSLIPVILEMANIPEEQKANSLTKKQKMELVKVFKHLTIHINGLEKIEVGIVSQGGVATKEINPKTMESKLEKGLYFTGEVIDVDAYTGGFNLQIAFSTGYLCGNSIM